MSSTIYDVLSNANYNLHHNGEFGLELAKEQLQNALTQIDNGKDLYDDFEEEE